MDNNPFSNIQTRRFLEIHRRQSRFETKATQTSRKEGDTTCYHHKGRQLQLFCEQCHGLACLNCLSSVHKGHSMCELCEIIPQRKLDIRNYIDKTEKNELVEIRKSILDTDALLQDNDCTFAKHSQDLKEQTETLKRELDRITSDRLSLYQRIKEENDKLIETYKEDLMMYEKKLQTQLMHCKTLLQKGSDIEIYDCQNECEKKSLPLKYILQDVNFCPNKSSRYYLELALGDFKIETQHQTLTDKGQPDGIHTATHDVTLRKKGRSEDIDTEALLHRRRHGQGTHSKEAKELDMWTSPCDIDSICPITGSQAWTSSGNTLIFMDKKGTLIHEIKHKAKINDISLSPTTHRLWVSDNNNKVMEMVSGRLVQRFSTVGQPRCLCITASDHILVGMSDKVSKFTTDGQMVNTVSFSDKTTSGFDIPEVDVLRITECPITSNVAMITNKGNVLVMDSDFNALFVRRCENIDGSRFNAIRGKDIDQMQYNVRTYKVIGMMYDSEGNIVIGKNMNHAIKLFSGDGQFLRYLHSKKAAPYPSGKTMNPFSDRNTVHYTQVAVGLDDEDLLWTVSDDNDIKLLQYTTKT